MNTVDEIILELERSVSEKYILGPDRWLEASQKLIVLLGNESDKLFTLQHQIAKAKAEHMNNGDTAAKAKVKAEAMPEYLEAQKLKAKIERVIEIVRIAKIQARLDNDNKHAN